MTTIKELKELDANATSAPWTYEPQDFLPERIWRGSKQICHVIGDSGETQENAQLIAATRNALPYLIRVIELAEDVFQNISNQQISTNWQDNIAVLNHARIMADKALSEIRKLKGA